MNLEFKFDKDKYVKKLIYEAINDVMNNNVSDEDYIEKLKKMIDETPPRQIIPSLIDVFFAKALYETLVKELI